MTIFFLLNISQLDNKSLTFSASSTYALVFRWAVLTCPTIWDKNWYIIQEQCLWICANYNNQQMLKKWGLNSPGYLHILREYSVIVPTGWLFQYTRLSLELKWHPFGLFTSFSFVLMGPMTWYNSDDSDSVAKSHSLLSLIGYAVGPSQMALLSWNIW